jgi:hypothetical protein
MGKTIIKDMFEEFYSKALPKNNMLSKEALEDLFYATLAFHSAYMSSMIGADIQKGMIAMRTMQKELCEHIEGRVNEHKKTQQN